MELKDLKEGEIYIYKGGFTFLFEYFSKGNKSVYFKHYICVENQRYYHNSNDSNGESTKEISMPTEQEKSWLRECIKAGEFIPLEEVKITNISNYSIWN